MSVEAELGEDDNSDSERNKPFTPLLVWKNIYIIFIFFLLFFIIFNFSLM